MTFETNNYVLFKYLEEWQEGRILEVVAGNDSVGEKRCYRILSFRTYTEVPSLVSENILTSSLENARKLRMVSLYESLHSMHVPVGIKNIIGSSLTGMDSKRLVAGPGETTVSSVIRGFGDFVLANKTGVLAEEVGEMVEGFGHCFNILVPRVLAFEEEVEALEGVEEGVQPADICRPGYLLRMIVFLERRILPTVRDSETRAIIFEYLTYMLDYLNSNMEKYFG